MIVLCDSGIVNVFMCISVIQSRDNNVAHVFMCTCIILLCDINIVWAFIHTSVIVFYHNAVVQFLYPYVFVLYDILLCMYFSVRRRWYCKTVMFYTSMSDRILLH